MNGNSQSPLPAEPRSIRLATCALGGALAGLVVGVWAIGLELGVECWHSGVSLSDFVESMMAGHVPQDYLDPLRIPAAVAPGVIFGLLSSLLSRRLRHPLALASLWASLLGLMALIVVLMLLWYGELEKRRPGEFLLLLAVLPVTGLIYGFALGFTARLLERGLQRLRG